MFLCREAKEHVHEVSSHRRNEVPVLWTTEFGYKRPGLSGDVYRCAARLARAAAAIAVADVNFDGAAEVAQSIGGL